MNAIVCDPRRVRNINDIPYKNGPIVYWMNRDQRIDDNWALVHAYELAQKHNENLIVIFNLHTGFLGGRARQHRFKIQGLKEVEERCEELNIPFVCVTGTNSEQKVLDWLGYAKAGLVVTDFSPLRIQRKWLHMMVDEIEIPIIQVDAHNVVPLWEVSSKLEVGARTIRRKIHNKLEEFLTEFPTLKPFPKKYTEPMVKQNWNELVNQKELETGLPQIEWITGGYKKGMKAAKVWIQEKLPQYGEHRNDALKEVQSDLSPFFHYGHIAPQKVATMALKDSQSTVKDIITYRQDEKSDHYSVAQYLEEMIVRRELADNFCLFQDKYDSFEGFPAWAQKSLNEHRNDKREYIYALKDFESANTHDELWNAAQNQMLQTGKMHGYMRMYWAKKILQWTKSPEDAMSIAIYLNDTYELDGRDPNGYTGIAWSIGGVHDRPWFDRPVFGKIRYMAESGVKKRFDIEAYKQKWNT